MGREGGVAARDDTVLQEGAGGEEEEAACLKCVEQMLRQA